MRRRTTESVRRCAVAGAAAGVVWRAAEPPLRRLFGHPYSDPQLLTALITRGRFQPLLDYWVQATGGAAFAAVFSRLGGEGTVQATLPTASRLSRVGS